MAAGWVPVLLTALEAGEAEAAAFPEGAERRERLQRLQRRITDSPTRGDRLDLRIGPADWDVISTCLGLAAKRLRSRLAAAFDRLANPAALAAPTDLGPPERVLAELESLESLASAFGEQAERAGFTRSGRRWILS